MIKWIPVVNLPPEASAMSGDHFTGATKMVVPTTFLCAGCGLEVHMDWVSPCFGLCEACEERTQQHPISYVPPDRGQPHGS